MSKNTRNRILLTALAALLLVTLAIGGTLAYLKDSTVDVTNTFTPSAVDIKLEETLSPDGDALKEDEKWKAQVIPGITLHKDPTVTVIGSSENVEIYLFIEIDSVAKVNGLKKLAPTLKMFYDVDAEWKALDSNANVYWKKIPASTDDTVINLIDGKQIVISTDITSADMDSYLPSSTDLKFKAYACQTYGLEVEAAWTQAQSATAYGAN